MSGLEQGEEGVLVSSEGSGVGILKLHAKWGDLEGGEGELDLSLDVREELNAEVGSDIWEYSESDGVLDSSGSGVGVGLVVAVVANLKVVGVVSNKDVLNINEWSGTKLIGVSLDELVSKGCRSEQGGSNNSLKHC